MKTTLTDLACRTLKLQPGEKQSSYYDTRTRGLALRVSARTKTWIFHTKVGAKVVRITLGTYPGMGLADAREEAEKVRSQIRRGEDPVAARRARIDAITEGQKDTIEALSERFMRVRVRPRCKPRSVANYEAFFKMKELARWKGRPARSIARKEVIQLKDELEATGQHSRTRLFMTHLGTFFRWLADNEVITVNPVVGIELAKSISDLARDRVLTLEEIARIWRGAGNGLGVISATFVKVLVLTALRRNECSEMRWSWLDLDSAEPTLVIPAPATKGNREHFVPLSPQVAGLLRAMPRLGDKYVFTNDGKRKISGYSKNKTAIERAMREAGEEVQDWRLHDLRRAFSSHCNEHELASSDTIEACLGHVSHRGAVQRVYDRSKRLAQRRRLMEVWAGAVMSAVEVSGMMMSNIVTMRRDV